MPALGGVMRKRPRPSGPHTKEVRVSPSDERTLPRMLSVNSLPVMSTATVVSTPSMKRPPSG